MVVLPAPVAFQWNRGNQGKNLVRHNVSDAESEEAFFDPGKKILRDVLHSGKERRFILLGATKVGRRLFIAFTIRHKTIRIISARDLNCKEYNLYEKEA